MTTQQLLDVLRDARDQGLWQEQAAIVEEIGPDVAHVRANYHLHPNMREDKLGKREIIAKLGWLREHWPAITAVESRGFRVVGYAPNQVFVGNSEP
jgi:hypothetical protein